MNKGQCLGTGTVLGFLVATAINGSLFPVQIHEKIVLVPEKKEVFLEEEKEVYLSLEQAERVYDPLRFHRDAFSQKDFAALHSLFLVADMHTLPEQNLCHYETFLENNILTQGSCVFLSPQLVLTNYHVASKKDPMLFSEFYNLKSSVRSFDGKRYPVQTLAVSPLYDLALVKTKKSSSAELVPIGYYEHGLSTTLFSFDEERKNMERYVTNTALHLETRFLLLENGLLGPNALVLERLYSPGDSGSPLFQAGRLVALLSYVDDKDMKSFVTPRVRQFVSEILQGEKK